MQSGVPGQLNGANAAKTVRRGVAQFQKSQGQGRVFQKPTEARAAPSLKTRPEKTKSSCTRKNRTAPSFQIVQSLLHLDRGENGQPVRKRATLLVSKYLKLKGRNPAIQQSYLQMKL